MKHRLLEESRTRTRRTKSILGFDSDGEGDSGSSSGERTIDTDSSSSVNSFYSKSSRQEYTTYEYDEMVTCAPVIGQRCIAQRSDTPLHSYGNHVSPFFSSPHNALMLSFISIISIVAFATLISEMREEYDTHSHP